MLILKLNYDVINVLITQAGDQQVQNERVKRFQFVRFSFYATRYCCRPMFFRKNWDTYRNRKVIVIALVASYLWLSLKIKRKYRCAVHAAFFIVVVVAATVLLLLFLFFNYIYYVFYLLEL